MIEDAVNGVRAAKAGSMKCLAITSTHTRKELMEADMIIDSFEEVNLEDLKRLFN